MSVGKAPGRGANDAETEGSGVEARAGRGRNCALIDCTGDAIPRAELERLLGELIAADAFGFRLTGDAVGISLAQARFAHVQLGERLYRLIVERDRARLEPF